MKAKQLLTLGLSLCVMAGCSNGGSSEKKDEAIATKIKDKTEITFWHAMNGVQEETLKDLTKKFEKENPNIKVNLQNQSNYKDLQNKLTNATASPDSLPNVTQAYADWMIDPIKDKMVLDLKPYMDNKELKFDNYNDIIANFRKSGNNKDGKIYSLPFNKSTEVLYYNKDMFKELGLKVPTTYKELADTAKTIKDKKGIAGVGFDSLNNYYMTYLKNEGKQITKDLDPTCTQSIDAAKYYQDGIKNGSMRIAGADRYLSGPFASKKVGMFIGSNAGEGFVNKGVNGKFEYGVAVYPAKYAMQQGTDLYVYDKGSAEQKTASYLYLKYLTSKDAQIEWGSKTGYIPVRTSAINDKKYLNSGSKMTTVLKDSKDKLFVNPTSKENEKAYREATTVLEKILTNKNADIKKEMESYKKTLKDIYANV